MPDQSTLGAASLMVASLIMAVVAQQPPAWQDPSKHRVSFVTVEEGVKLEVLDWGGPGRPVILLAGAGNTAHVFDDFVPKLTDRWHVYGITRRGFGASSQPASGYGDQRLADDVFQVMNALSIAAPVLVGHSMAGGELTTIGREHPNRISGLIYLDALGDPRDWTGSDPAYMALFQKLPAPMRTPPPPPTGEESKSFSAYRAMQMRNNKFAFPESELRNIYKTNPDGTKGERISTPTIFRAIGDGQIKRDYSGITVPVLAFYEFTRSPGDPPRTTGYQAKDADERAAIDAFDFATTAYVSRWRKNLLSSVPNAQFIDLPGAGHYVFLTRETEVLHGIREFLAALP